MPLHIRFEAPLVLLLLKPSELLLLKGLLILQELLTMQPLMMQVLLILFLLLLLRTAMRLRAGELRGRCIPEHTGESGLFGWVSERENCCCYTWLMLLRPPSSIRLWLLAVRIHSRCWR